MKIGIIIYSITGNTRSVAKRLLESLQEKGFDTTLLEIKTLSDNPDDKVELVESPSTVDFDRLIFASPVHAFMASKVIKTYLSKIENLNQKEVTLFVTHHFPKAWMGANSALRQMKKHVERKNGMIHTMVSINWSSKKREQNIQELINKFIS